MAITDNTAKWQVKKLTNFTDKSAEIATQAQAEEGVDNTKIMTPLRVKNAIDKQRPMKTFTSLAQLGLTPNASESDIAIALPNYSMFISYFEKSSFPNMSLPINGVFVVNRTSSNGVTFRLTHTDEGRFLEYVAQWVSWQSPSFSGWNVAFNSTNIATQSQAEAGTDNMKVMTPLRTKNAIDKQRPLKTFTSLKQLGLGNNATIEQICETMPSNSSLLLNMIASVYPNITPPWSGVDGQLVITCNEASRTTMSFSITSGNFHPIYTASYANWANPKFSGWQKLATQGALSMPSGSYIGITAPTIVSNSSGSNGIDVLYTAPTDGWLVFEVIVSNNNEHAIWVRADSGVIASQVYSTWRTSYFTIPLSKGQKCGLSYININEVSNMRFIYAQSEV